MRLVTKIASLLAEAEAHMSDTVSADTIAAATGSGIAPASPSASVIAAPQNREARERMAVQMHQTMLRQKIAPADLSARSGIPVDTLLGIIFGANVDVSLTSLEVLAQVFGLRFDYGFTQPQAPRPATSET